MKTKTQKGITLIALIITIIVMLILVGVSVSVALNTGLFKAAQGAAKNTEAHRLNETKLSNGTITLEDGTTDSIQNIVNSYKGGSTGEGPINITNEGETKYIMKIDDKQYKIDEKTTFSQLANATGASFEEKEGEIYMNSCVLSRLGISRSRHNGGMALFPFDGW